MAIQRAARARLTRRTALRRAGLATAGAAAFLVACGGDDEETAAPQTNPASTQAAGSPGAGASPAAGAAQPVRGGTLRLAKQQVDEGLDPGLKVVNDLEFLAGMYNHTHIYQVSTNTILLDAATKQEQPDPTTVRFTMRSGMKFHNGDPVTAEDVAYTWSRFPDLLKNQGSQVNEANWGFIDKVTAPDATTVVVTLKAPTASALMLMGTTAFGIINKRQAEANDKKNVQEVDAGAGPFKLDKRDAGGSRLVRFPEYYKHEQPNILFGADSPYIDAWETGIIVDAAAAKSAFLAGNLDLYPQLGNQITDKREFDSLKNQRTITAKEVDPVGTGMYMAFDNARFQDKRARQAIRQAINYDALIATIYEGNGVLDAPIGVGQPSWALDQNTLKTYYKFDAAEAKKNWEAAGKPFPTIRIQLNQQPIAKTFGDFLKQQLETNLGVKVELLVADTTTWVARAREPQKQWELFIVPAATSGNVPEAGNMFFMAPKAFAGVSWNFAVDQAGTPEVAAAAKTLQDLLDAQSRELDPARRKQRTTDMQKWILDNIQPGINLPAQGKNWIAYNARLQNVPEQDFLKGLGLRSHAIWIKPS